jgi:hypothetical protein
MSKKLYFLISFVLVLSLASISYGADPCVVGDWEGNDDGWIDWQLTGQPRLDTAGPPKYSYSPTMGVTRGKKSLKVTPPAGWQQNISVLLENRPGARGAFLANTAFAVDVTYNSADWDPNTTYASIYELSINAEGYGWNDVGGAASPAGTNGVVFIDTLNPDSPGNLPIINPGVPGTTLRGTLIWNYSAILPGGSYPGSKITVTPTTGYLGIIFASNSDTVGSFYFDNAILFDSAYAHHPEPRDGQINVPVDTNLAWMAGDYAQYHDIYFGTSFAEVNDAVNTDPCGPTEVYRGRQDVGNEDYNIPETLGPVITYYWRVDEVSDTCEPYLWKGEIWSFTTEGKAVNPTPADMAGEIGIVGLKLSWTPGYQAASHDVYLGSSFAEVNEAENTDPCGPTEVYRGRQDANSYNIPETLGIGKTYYWRIDEVNNALPPGLWKGDIWQFTTKFGKAKNPNPANEATGIHAESVQLSWTAGGWVATVNGHDVYIGSNFADVNSADHNDPEFKGRQSSTTYNLAGPLDLDTTYYWRIDEVNTAHLPDQIWRGDVWSFTTADYRIVDNFESYADLTALQAVWKKGTSRALVYLNTNVTYLHDGDQSMQFLYRDGSSPWYSEAYADTATLPSGIGSNWSTVKLLRLYFYGLAANDPNEPMYVKLTDGSSPAHTAKVLYDGDRTDLKEASWHEWNIPLPDFTGVDMSNVTRITIGFGDGVSSPSINSTIYFDDIRLYKPSCVLSARSADFAKADYAPAGDPGGDCIIDYRELEIMANTWLAEDEVITPTTDPNIAGGLTAYYPLNEGVGATAYDNTPEANDGTFSDAGVTWITPGLMGAGAVHVDGNSGSRIDIGNWNPVAPNNQVTLAIWAKWDGPTTRSQGLIGKRDAWAADGLMFMFEISPFNNNQLALRQYSVANTDVTSVPVTMTDYIGRWTHLAATFDGSTATLYINGADVNSGPFYFGTGTSASMAIGNTHGSAGNVQSEVFNGDLDEVRIYSRALSAAEIAYLADTTPGDSSLHVPVPSSAELYEGETEGHRIVNFRDFAYLANMWLEEQLWPR